MLTRLDRCSLRMYSAASRSSARTRRAACLLARASPPTWGLPSCSTLHKRLSSSLASHSVRWLTLFPRFAITACHTCCSPALQPCACTAGMPQFIVHIRFVPGEPVRAGYSDLGHSCFFVRRLGDKSTCKLQCSCLVLHAKPFSLSWVPVGCHEAAHDVGSLYDTSPQENPRATASTAHDGLTWDAEQPCRPFKALPFKASCTPRCLSAGGAEPLGRLLAGTASRDTISSCLLQQQPVPCGCPRQTAPCAHIKRMGKTTHTFHAVHM